MQACTQHLGLSSNCNLKTAKLLKISKIINKTEINGQNSRNYDADMHQYQILKFQMLLLWLCFHNDYKRSILIELVKEKLTFRVYIFGEMKTVIFMQIKMAK